MSSFAMILAFVAAVTIFSNFYDLPVEYYRVYFPLVSMLGSLILFFNTVSLKRKLEENEYKDEVDRLRDELQRTKQRVAEGVTAIEYPEYFGRAVEGDEEKKYKKAE
jgi:hypothetical protein